MLSKWRKNIKTSEKNTSHGSQLQSGWMSLSTESGVIKHQMNTFTYRRIKFVAKMIINKVKRYILVF